MAIPDKDCNWNKIEIENGKWTDRVYSLDVAKHHSYVADGLVTLNSIYGFRGAQPENFTKVAMRPDFHLFRLEMNYRSDIAICMAQNRLISNNSLRIQKSSMPVSHELGEVQFNEFDSEQLQANAICSTLAELPQGQTAAVLTRTNWLADSLSTTLRGMGLPVFTRKLAETPEDWRLAKMIVAFFIRPENNLLAFRMMVLTRGEDQAKDIQRRSLKTGQSINAMTLKVPALVPVEAMPQALARLNVSAEAVARVVEAIASLETRTLTELSHAMNLNEQVEDNGHPDAPITVCTVHASKGKEFDRVFLPSWNQEIFPAKAKDEALEELRRVAFVAVSRAKSRVWVGMTKTHRMHSKAFTPAPMTRSQFAADMTV
jgi:DNA helicase-2/ATP-dependent DNA helicase PcrA